MKTLLLIMLIAVPSLLINGQTKGFKTIYKQPAETAQPDSNFKQINGQNALKSASSHKYATGKALSFPGFSGTAKSKVIRKDNSPVYIEQSNTPLKSATCITNEERFYAFLEEFKGITDITYPRESFKISGIHTDNLGVTHIKAYQQYKSIDIYGSESTLHIDAQKERYTGSFCKVQENIPDDPKIDIDQALQRTILDLQLITVYRELTPGEKKFLQYESPTYSLVFYDKGEKTYVLTWAITIRPNFIEEWKYFIDAASGGIIHKFNNTNMDGPAIGTGVDLNNVTRTFDVYLEGDTYYLKDVSERMFKPLAEEGVIITLDANNTSTKNLDYSFITSVSNTWTQQAAISAHCNAIQTYEYFNKTFGRNSINGKGGDIISLINVTEIDGSPLENAFWNGQAVFYGNAGKNFKPLAGALDVTAHELGHGVVSNTANLDYYGQSGSINETYADIFASMVDRDDWLIGEDVTKTEYSPSGALRNMADPHNMGDNTKIYWQPKHITEMYLGNDDSKGVHINSGIGNHVYYLFASAIGKDKAEKVFYRALTEYLTKTSQFINFKIAVIQSAVDLYGADSPEAIKAGEAFDAVGIYDEEIVDDNQVFAVNPGDEFLFSYDTKISDPVSLYLSTAEGTGYSPMSKTSMMGKVSVTDDGSRAVFVSTDHRIRMISTDPLNTNEQIISGYAFYDNIAISKDGKRLAVTKIYADASIYVIDLESGKGTRFILYNPTTGQFNTNTGGVLYADALEFDVTGEYLIYDACNAISSKTQEDIYYWDIGFIKVWDNNKQNFGNGSISKLFNTLPDNISIANPVFSNNSPFIIAFDGFSSVGFTEEFGVYAANFETGEIKKIIDNDRLGYPSFSRNDNRIAYSATNIFGMQVVESIKLASDKITSRGDPGVLVPDAKWPVYFATGNRALGLPPGANFIADYRYGDAPLKVKYIDISTNNPTSWQWTFQGGTPSSSNEQFPVVTYEAPGTYKVSMEATNYIGSNTISKEGYIIVSGATGIDDLEINTLLYYPNPVSDFLTIGFNDDFSVRIYNLQGELLLTRENEPKLDLSSMNPGIYIMELETKNELSRHKLMKE